MAHPCQACGEPLGKGGRYYHQRCIPLAKRRATGHVGGTVASHRARVRKIGKLADRAPSRMTRGDLIALLHDAEMSGYNRCLQMVAREQKRAGADGR